MEPTLSPEENHAMEKANPVQNLVFGPCNSPLSNAHYHGKVTAFQNSQEKIKKTTTSYEWNYLAQAKAMYPTKKIKGIQNSEN